MLDEHLFSDHRYMEKKIMDKCTSVKRIVNLRKTNFEYYKKLKEKGLGNSSPYQQETKAQLEELKVKHKPP